MGYWRGLVGELELQRDLDTFAELFALFLEDVEATKDEDTFLDCPRWCTEFARAHGNEPARSVTKAQANDWLADFQRKQNDENGDAQ